MCCPPTKLKSVRERYEFVNVDEFVNQFVLFLFCFPVTPIISDYSWEVYIVHSGVFAG